MSETIPDSDENDIPNIDAADQLRFEVERLLRIPRTTVLNPLSHTPTEGAKLFGFALKKQFPKDLHVAASHLVLKGYTSVARKFVNETLRTLAWIHGGRLPAHRRRTQGLVLE